MSFKIGLKTGGDLSKARAFMDEYPQRMKAAKRVLVRQFAETFRKELLNRLPDTPGWIELYRDSLTVKEIEMPDEDAGFAVIGEASVELEDMDADETLVFFGMHFNARPSLPARTAALFDPWTIDQIPPIRGGYEMGSAILVVRQGSKEEVEARRQQLIQQRGEIVQAFQDSDLRIQRQDVLKVEGAALVDLAFLAARLEFGKGGFKAFPHWRPAIQSITKDAQEMTRKHVQGRIEKILGDPDFDEWKSDLESDADTIDLGIVEQFSDFGERFGLQ